jgi:hypothetical protein
MVKPFGLTVEPVAELEALQAEHARLASRLERERSKVGKLKQQLRAGAIERGTEVTRLFSNIQTLQARLRQLHGERAASERLPTAGSQDERAWAMAVSRARARVSARSRFLDGVLAKPGGADGLRDACLAQGWPKLDPPVSSGVAQAWSPLRIAVVGESRSPFLAFADPRMLARPLGDALVADADVLVFPRVDIDDYLANADLVPERLWARIREGKTTLALDGSQEGFPWWHGFSEKLHAFLASRGVDPGFAAYLTQDRQFRSAYEPWCAREGVNAMRVVVFDAFIHRTLQTFEQDGRQVFEQRLAEFQRRPAMRSRRFLSLNYAPRPTKVMFLLRLLRDGLWDKGWISFGGFSGAADLAKQGRAAMADQLLGLNGFADDVDSVLPFMEPLDAMGPMLFGSGGQEQQKLSRRFTLSADDLPQYADSWFTVVTESEMNRRVMRITEKPLKPLLNLHPFLVLGSPGSLKLLRDYGFETYCDIFDERYDEETSVRRRFDMVYEQVRRLCVLDEAEMARMSEKAAEVMTFNACWGLTELPRRFNETIGSELIAQLAPAGRPERAASR